MIIPKQYLHDRRVLLVGSINAFLVLLLVISTVFRLDTSHSSFIVQYRDHVPVDAFRSGAASELYAFALLGLIVFVFHLFLSFRLYLIHRQLAITVLGLGSLLLILALIVSNALLVLR
jgi:hypothetical protein